MSDATPEAAIAARVQKLEPSTVKRCCADVYDSDAARMLLGESFHPGGTRMTERLGHLLNLALQHRVLDVAAGRGANAIFLSKQFGCEVVGIDYSGKNVDAANSEAKACRLSDRVSFQWADAEKLPFPDASFDAIICECAFCTFPDKRAAAREFHRVLRSRGQVGLSDLTRDGARVPALESLMAWIACIADARPLTEYAALLSDAAFVVTATENHDHELADFVGQIRTRLLAAEVMARLQKLRLPGFDFEAAKRLIKHALAAIKAGNLGYAILVASKSDPSQASLSEVRI
jgi:arsenite methyltransferase